MANGCSLIITDDDHEDASLLKDCMIAGSFKGNITLAEDGEVLLEILKRKENKVQLPDMLLLDLNMPRINGYEVIKALNKDDILQHIPRVVITSSLSDNDEIICRQLGCRAYFKKPYNLKGFDELADQIVKMMRAENKFC